MNKVFLLAKRVLSLAWLPTLKPKALNAVVVHWTGGNHQCSSLDKLHYHFIIDGDCQIHTGIFSVKSNARPFRAATGYAAHARNFNAGAVGVSLCGMAGATEVPFRAGAYPITREQWDTAVQVVAEICIAYDIPVTPKTVLQHGEIQKNTGVKQRGKWDCCKLPWAPEKSSAQVCDEFRALVIQRIQQIKNPPSATTIRKLYLQIGSEKAEVKNATKLNNSWYCEGTDIAQTIFELTGKRYGFGGHLQLREHLTRFSFNVSGGVLGVGLDDVVRIYRMVK